MLAKDNGVRKYNRFVIIHGGSFMPHTRRRRVTLIKMHCCIKLNVLRNIQNEMHSILMGIIGNFMEKV